MTQVEIYQPPISGTALDPARGASLEDEIRETRERLGGGLGLRGLFGHLTRKKTGSDLDRTDARSAIRLHYRQRKDLVLSGNNTHDVKSSFVISEGRFV